MTTNGSNAASAATPSCACCAPTTLDLAAIDADAGLEAGEGASATQEVRVTVKGGYQPSTVRIAKGVPARIVFDRQEASRCSEHLLIDAFGVSRALPANERTTIEIPAAAPGSYAFTCGMRMLKGEIVVS